MQKPKAQAVRVGANLAQVTVGICGSIQRIRTLLVWAIALQAPITVGAQEYRFAQDQWTAQNSAGGAVQWDGGGAALSAKSGSAGTAKITCNAPLTGDFTADVSFELVDWPGGLKRFISFGWGITTPGQTPAERQQLVRVGREWDGSVDEYRANSIKGARAYYRAGVIAVERTGQLRIQRRGGEVRAQYHMPAGWVTLQVYSMYLGEPVQLVLNVTNGGGSALEFPAVNVRFTDLRVQVLPPLKPGQPAGASPTGGAWLIYSTGPGWLRIGSQKEFASEQKTQDEIFGGGSDAPLAKTALQPGFSTRAAAFKFLCGHITKVTVQYMPIGQPHEVIRGVYDGKEYYLRLTGGDDPEALTKADNYDEATEQGALKDQGITPRRGFARQWLIHITGHGTVNGDVRDDSWILFNRPPTKDPAHLPNGNFVQPDGVGGTIGYSCDQWEGPYRDNFGLARALKRLNVPEAALYPPGATFTQKVVAADVPDDPRDYGSAVLGVQPIVDSDALSDWVAYLTGGVWLHVGTRAEFEYPVKSSETLWAGPGDEVMQRESMPLGTRFASYDEAMRELTSKLTDVHSSFHPTVEPKETVAATLNGKLVHLQLAHDPVAVTASYGSYNYGAEVAALKQYGKAPTKRFQRQWLVHANGVGTQDGPQKRDMWMMVGAQPQNNAVAISDASGGTYTFSLDSVEGPFQESGPLSNAMKGHGLKSIHLFGEERDLSVDETTTPAPDNSPPEKPEILSITPDHGEAGQTFYITVIATGMQPGYRLRFGSGVTVTHETSLGKNPDGPGERWLATIAIDKDSTFKAAQ